jgi:hypothetical protein
MFIGTPENRFDEVDLGEVPPELIKGARDHFAREAAPLNCEANGDAA